MKKERRAPVLVIIGSTASGKSDTAVMCALKYNGEIISADSRQVYKHLNHTTGKITEKEKKGVPHHMLDIIEPGTEYNVYRYAQEGIHRIQEIYNRGRVPIITGGTGFYIDALLFTNSTSKAPVNLEYRKKLAKRKKEELQQELYEKDKEAYTRIDTENPRRLIRALEVIRTFGSFEKQKQKKRYSCHIIGIQHSRKYLYERIEKRLNNRFEAMIEEIKKLLDDGIDPIWLDNLGLECRHITRMLTQNISKEKTHDNLLKAIIAYAKRQETWWKRYPETVWYQSHEFGNMHKSLSGIYGGSART